MWIIGEGSSRNMFKGHMDKAKGDWDHGYEVEMGGAGTVEGGKMETTVFQQ